MEEIKFKKSDDGCIIYATGEIDLSNSHELRKTILAALKTDQKVEVDLCQVSYIDSSGIASLVEGLQFAKSESKLFVLSNPSKQVKAIMELARLDKVFTIISNDNTQNP
ncbi:MAG: STAS domain-containing protein [Marinicellaceae bacterium]